MLRKFRFVLNTVDSHHFGITPVSPAVNFKWRDRLDAMEKSGSSFSPKVAKEVLELFKNEYIAQIARKRVRREMVNDPCFIRLLSSCIRHLDAFSTVDLVSFIHMLTIGIDWRDKTLLRSVEPVIIERLPQMASESVVAVLESYAKLKCGSRPLWESLISAISSMHMLDSEVYRAVKVVCENPTSFYKPTYVLSALHPTLEQIAFSGSVCNAELANIIKAYGEWQNAIKSETVSRRFLSRLIHCLDMEQFDIELFSEILVVIASRKLMSGEIVDFLNNFQKSIILNKHKNSASPETIHKSFTALFKLARMDAFSYKPELFIHLSELVRKNLDKFRPTQIVPIVSVCARAFGLVHSPRGNLVNFGPPEESIPDLFTEKIMTKIAEFSAKEISKLMDSYSIIRKGSPELWAGLTTVLGQLDLTELAPEEIESVLFALGEMNLGICQELKNSIILQFFEKINLFKNFNCFLFFLSVCLDHSDAGSAAIKAVEMMDVFSCIDSKEPSIVLLNLAIRSLMNPRNIEGGLSELINHSNHDLHLFLSSSQAIIHPSVLESCSDSLSEFFHDALITRNITRDGLLIDFLVEDKSKKLALLVSSPLEVIHGKTTSRPTGTAILRHRATQAVLGTDWNVCNINASDWLHAHPDARHDILNSISENLSGPRDAQEPSTTIVEKDASFKDNIVTGTDFDDKMDISPFVRKDRLAPHRKCPPPSDSLPWIPTIMSLKTKRGNKRRTKRL